MILLETLNLIWKKVNGKNIPYIIIVILLIALKCQNSKNNIVENPIIKVDTVYTVKIVRDTVPGKTVYIKGAIDTVWLTKDGFIPKPTYDALLEQYKELGNLYFKRNTFSTRFDIKNYGYVTVKDSISENWLSSSELQSFLDIPEKTITITEKSPPRRQLYIGGGIMGYSSDPVNIIHTGFLYKDKKDQIFGASIGYSNNQLQYGVSSYFKIKLKKSN